MKRSTVSRGAGPEVGAALVQQAGVLVCPGVPRAPRIATRQAVPVCAPIVLALVSRWRALPCDTRLVYVVHILVGVLRAGPAPPHSCDHERVSLSGDHRFEESCERTGRAPARCSSQEYAPVV